MKTTLTLPGSLLLFCSTIAFAQTSGTGNTGGDAETAGAANATSSGLDTASGPGVVTDRTRNPSVNVVNPASPNSSAVGVLVRDGKPFLMRGGKLEPVDKPMSLTLSPEGEITGFDGKTVTLPDGHMLTMDGRLTDIPAGVAGLVIPGLPPQAMPDSEMKANKEMAEANSEGVVNRMDTRPTDEGVNTNEMENGGGGGGSSNRPRRSSMDNADSGGSGQ